MDNAWCLRQYLFPQQTHGLEGQLPFVVLRDAIAHMPEWPEGEYFFRTTRQSHGQVSYRRKCSSAHFRKSTS